MAVVVVVVVVVVKVEGEGEGEGEGEVEVVVVVVAVVVLVVVGDVVAARAALNRTEDRCLRENSVSSDCLTSICRDPCAGHAGPGSAAADPVGTGIEPIAKMESRLQP